MELKRGRGCGEKLFVTGAAAFVELAGVGAAYYLSVNGLDTYGAMAFLGATIAAVWLVYEAWWGGNGGGRPRRPRGGGGREPEYSGLTGHLLGAEDIAEQRRQDQG